MKKILLFLFTLFSIQAFGQGPNLEMLIFPKYIEGGIGERGDFKGGIPYVYRARITGLKAGKTYRYENKLVDGPTAQDEDPRYRFILPPTNVIRVRRVIILEIFSDRRIQLTMMQTGHPIEGNLLPITVC